MNWEDGQKIEKIKVLSAWADAKVDLQIAQSKENQSKF